MGSLKPMEYIYFIDNIFWNMPLKNPTHADSLIILIRFIMLVMRIMVIQDDHAYYCD